MFSPSSSYVHLGSQITSQDHGHWFPLRKSWWEYQFAEWLHLPWHQYALCSSANQQNNHRVCSIATQLRQLSKLDEHSWSCLFTSCFKNTYICLQSSYTIQYYVMGDGSVGAEYGVDPTVKMEHVNYTNSRLCKIILSSLVKRSVLRSSSVLK